MPTNLQGVTVLVTRPAHQQAAFIAQLAKLDAKSLSLPCLAIRWLEGSALIQLEQLQPGQIIIFTSPNSVQAANNLVPFPWVCNSQKKPGGQKYTILAIGPGTAKMLDHFGMPVDQQPVAPYNSESLLSLKQLQDINLQKVSIIKGRGGRHYLADWLNKRAGAVETIEVYERYKPEIPQNSLDSIFLKSALDIVTITSNEALQNLVDSVDKPETERHKERLLQLPLVVNSERGAELAKDLCFQSHVLVAPTAGDSGQVDAIKLWNSSYRFTL